MVILKENASKLALARIPFTKAEEAALIRGVEVHGTGAWAVILGSGCFAPQRTNMDLKDRWRNMATGIEKGIAEEKRVPARLIRKRPARSLPPAADSRAKRMPQADDQLIGLRPYLSDIHRLYQETEGLKHASASYMSKQIDINAKMRAILIDWLVEVHSKFKLVAETLYLTVSLIDRFLEREQIPRNKLQLVGVTAMFVACKYEEVFPPACSDFVFVSDKLYSREEILRMEGLILSTLGFELTSPSAFVFIRRIAKVAGIATAPRSTTELLANYLLELTLQEDRMRVYLPSLLCAAAIWLTLTLTLTLTPPPPLTLTLTPPLTLTRSAAAIWLALKTRGEQPWSAALAQHSTYTEADLQPCVRDLHGLHGMAAATSLQAVYKKYTREEYRSVGCIEPVCSAQLDLAPPKAAPPVVALRENLYSAPLVSAPLVSAPRTTRYGPKSAARRWAGAVVVVD
jgi:hypothetical protein